MNKQAETPTFFELREKGWTIHAAARKLGLSAGHISRVVNGKREASASLVSRLRALPARQPWEINLRERIAK